MTKTLYDWNLFVFLLNYLNLERIVETCDKLIFCIIITL